MTSRTTATTSVLARAAAALLAAAALAACGTSSAPGGTSGEVSVEPVSQPGSIQDPGHRADAQGVAEVTAVLGPALAGGNGKRACSLMAVSAQERVQKAVGRANCVDAVAALTGRLTADEREVLAHLQASRVTVTGTGAVASLAKGSDGPMVVSVFGAAPAFAISEERWSLL